MRQVFVLLFMCVMAVSAPVGGYAQMPNKIKGESMAQKWEYKVILRYRTAKDDERGYVFGIAVSDWLYKEDGKEAGSLDMVAKLKELGESGWELVSVVPQSTSVGEAYAGFTSEVIWLFKRPK